MLFNLFVNDPDFEWLMIDASYIKVHPHATGAKGGNQAMGRTKGAQYENSHSGRFIVIHSFSSDMCNVYVALYIMTTLSKKEEVNR